MTGRLRCKNRRFEHNRPAHAFKLTESFPTRPHASRLVQYFVSEIPVNAAKKEGSSYWFPCFDGPLTPFSNAKVSLRASITRLYVVRSFECLGLYGNLDDAKAALSSQVEPTRRGNPQSSHARQAFSHSPSMICRCHLGLSRCRCHHASHDVMIRSALPHVLD